MRCTFLSLSQLRVTSFVFGKCLEKFLDHFEVMQPHFTHQSLLKLEISEPPKMYCEIKEIFRIFYVILQNFLYYIFLGGGGEAPPETFCQFRVFLRIFILDF